MKTDAKKDGFWEIITDSVAIRSRCGISYVPIRMEVTLSLAWI